MKIKSSACEKENGGLESLMLEADLDRVAV